MEVNMPENLRGRLISITKQIDKVARENGLNSDRPFLRPIYDGICSSGSYFNQSVKLMFILKEPYDTFTQTGQPKGGNWSMTKDYFKDPEWVSWDPYKTTFFVAKTAKAILDSDFSRRFFDSTSMYDPNTYEVMNKVAYINLSKMPASTATNNAILEEKYISYWQDIVKEQIKLFNPDIIICCGTFSILDNKEPLIYNHITNNKSYNGGNVSTYIWDYYGRNRLLVDAYHPSASRYSYDYINGIRQAWLRFNR